jgi:hypothetical protein
MVHLPVKELNTQQRFRAKWTPSKSGHRDSVKQLYAALGD